MPPASGVPVTTLFNPEQHPRHRIPHLSSAFPPFVLDAIRKFIYNLHKYAAFQFHTPPKKRRGSGIHKTRPDRTKRIRTGREAKGRGDEHY